MKKKSLTESLKVDFSDAAAVVDDLEVVGAAFLQLDLHVRGPGIDRVLKQLLHGCREIENNLKLKLFQSMSWQFIVNELSS